MNWAAWILLFFIVLDLPVIYWRIANGRKAMQPVDSAGAAVIAVILSTAVVVVHVWLFLLAVGVIK